MSLTRSRPYLLVLLMLAAAAGQAAPAYISPQDVQLERFLAPPPAANSAAQQADLAAVLDIQRNRTAGQAAEAQADDKVSVFRFADVLGEKFSEEKLPKTAALAQKACNDSSAVTGAAKKLFSRPRPYVTSAEVKPVVSNVTSESYPSGHATCGYLWAILLADMVPERRDELFARGTRYGMNRVVGGVHYPTDAEAGRLSAAVIAAVMLTTPAFRSDFAAARAELRAALGY
jgi:acid phosphatase (class A)